MEILRFNEAESTTPKRKKSSRGMIALGLVATLFGVGSALASTTIQINSGGAVDVGQGVSTVTACDSTIDIQFASALKSDKSIESGKDDVLDDAEKLDGTLKGKPKFYTDSIIFSGVDRTAYNTVTGEGCGGELFELQIYYKVPEDKSADEVVKPFTCGQLGLAGDDGKDDSDNDVGNTGIQKVICSAKGKITFEVIPDDTGSTLILALGKNKVVKTLRTALDISYFTLISRTPTA